MDLVLVKRLLWRGHNGGLLATSFGFVFALRYHGNDYLYDVGDVGIRLGTARVVADVAGGVKVHQRPLAVRNVVRRVSIFAHLKHVRFGPELVKGRFLKSNPIEPKIFVTNSTHGSFYLTQPNTSSTLSN